MNIHPRPDQELKIQEAIRSGFIKHESDLIDMALNLLYSKKQSQAETAIRLAGFGKRHNLSLSGLSPKDLINEGRI